MRSYFLAGKRKILSRPKYLPDADLRASRQNSPHFVVTFRLLDHSSYIESADLDPMAAIWFLLFDKSRVIMNVRLLGVSTPE